jgi:hypothetical protein
MEIDLRNCKEGDKLRIRFTGEFAEKAKELFSDIVTYVGKLPDKDEYDHKIQYSNGSYGSRCHDGSTFKHNKRTDDPDIIEIL